MSNVKRVLLVDDDDALRNMLSEQLNLHEDFAVTEADGPTSDAATITLTADGGAVVLLSQPHRL